MIVRSMVKVTARKNLRSVRCGLKVWRIVFTSSHPPTCLSADSACSQLSVQEQLFQTRDHRQNKFTSSDPPKTPAKLSFRSPEGKFFQKIWSAPVWTISRSHGTPPRVAKCPPAPAISSKLFVCAVKWACVHTGGYEGVFKRNRCTKPTRIRMSHHSPYQLT